jgi:hypothetical protein
MIIIMIHMMYTPIILIPTLLIIMIQVLINGVDVVEYPFVVGYKIDGVIGDKSVDGFGIVGPDAEGGIGVEEAEGDPKDEWIPEFSIIGIRQRLAK